MNVNDMFPSKWLKADDLEEGERRVLTIKDVRYEEVGQKKEQKPILEFREDKPMILNKTNASVIAHLYGNHTDEWIGKKVVIYVTEVDSFGDKSWALRVRNEVPQTTVAQPPAPQAVSPGTGDNTLRARVIEAARKAWPDSDIRQKEMKRLLPNGLKDTSDDELKTVLLALENTSTSDFDDSDPFADEY
jgi:hypothetical protein